MRRKILWTLGALLVAIQFIRPGRNNQPADPAVDLQAVLHPPAEVSALLKEACYDCHSNETRYPWYAQVAPVSWWIANHVVEGREHLNFSEFGRLPAEDAAEAIEESIETIDEGNMPLPSYTWLGMHPRARLSAQQRGQLTGWFRSLGMNESAGEGNEED